MQGGLETSDGPPAPHSPGRTLSTQHRLIFYVAIPAIIAITSALRGRLPDKGLSIFFWLLHSLPAWWLNALATHALYRLFAPWRPPLIPLLLIGSVSASVLVMLYTRGVFLLTGDLFDNINDPSRYPSPGFTSEFASFYVEHFVGGILVWTAVNLFYDRVLGFPRYRYPAPEIDVGPPERASAVAAERREVADAHVAQPATQLAAFLRRLPAHLGTHVLALEAEEHYLKVHTDRGSTLILYRFTDAIEEMPAQLGLRVHRSFWVRRDAVAAVRLRGRSYALELTNGLQVPVSLTYKGALVAAGLHVPATPSARGQAVG